MTIPPGHAAREPGGHAQTGVWRWWLTGPEPPGIRDSPSPRLAGAVRATNCAQRPCTDATLKTAAVVKPTRPDRAAGLSGRQVRSEAEHVEGCGHRTGSPWFGRHRDWRRGRTRRRHPQGPCRHVAGQAGRVRPVLLLRRRAGAVVSTRPRPKASSRPQRPGMSRSSRRPIVAGRAGSTTR